jgi:hypothetical protein
MNSTTINMGKIVAYEIEKTTILVYCNVLPFWNHDDLLWSILMWEVISSSIISKKLNDLSMGPSPLYA